MTGDQALRRQVQIPQFWLHHYQFVSFQTLPIGTKVLKKNCREAERKGGKMNERWIGPYTVESVTGKGLYILNKDGRTFKTAVNPGNVKIYNE